MAQHRVIVGVIGVSVLSVADVASHQQRNGYARHSDDVLNEFVSSPQLV